MARNAPTWRSGDVRAGHFEEGIGFPAFLCNDEGCDPLSGGGKILRCGVRRIDWPRNKFIRRTLKPFFFLVNILILGDVMVAILKKAAKDREERK